MDHVYNSQLQSYALKQHMDLPVYAAERQGHAHTPRFRCNVTVCGQTFQSQEFFTTLKAAKNAAAKVALTHFNLEGVDVAYKNLLQEIAQKENYPLPVYANSTSGQSHAPTFTSTVEFAGNVYKGEEARTKKLAEMSAAKVAFMSIKCGQPNQPPSPSFPCERQEAANSNVKSSAQVSHSQPSKMVVTPDVPSKCIEVHEEELEDVPNETANKDINITALPVATHATNDVTLTAPVTNAVEMNIVGAESSAMPQNYTNELEKLPDLKRRRSMVEDKKLRDGRSERNLEAV